MRARIRRVLRMTNGVHLSFVSLSALASGEPETNVRVGPEAFSFFSAQPRRSLRLCGAFCVYVTGVTAETQRTPRLRREDLLGRSLTKRFHSLTFE